MEELLLNKCVYKRIDGLYVLPLAWVRATKATGTRLDVKIIKNHPNSLYKENAKVSYNLGEHKTRAPAKKSFLEMYEPYIWEGGLFERNDGISIFIYSIINNEFCDVYYFSSSDGNFLTLKRIFLRDALGGDLKERELASSYLVPDLIYRKGDGISKNDIWCLDKIRKYYAIYCSTYSTYHHSHLILKDKILNGQNICFTNGKLLEGAI